MQYTCITQTEQKQSNTCWCFCWSAKFPADKQVQLLFSVQTAALVDPSQQSEEHLAFVRYYAVKDDTAEKQQHRHLTMQHLKWETVQSGKGKGQHRAPSYGVVEACSISKVTCYLSALCPTEIFLLNDVLELWPDLQRIPKDEPQRQDFLQETMQALAIAYC